MNLDPELRELNKQSLTELRDAWQSGRLTVIVGAGASYQSGLPLWNELLERMLATWVEQKYQSTLLRHFSSDIQDYLKKELQGQSPIVFAHYLQAQLSEKAFVDLVHRCLYQGLSSTPRPGPIMRAIGRLGSKLRSVITFNFDDLVETALNLEGSQSTSISKATHLSKIRGVPVYHPHGFLPYEQDPNESYSVVIAESDYHTLYSNPHSWNNLVFSTALLENTCLFVTTSITDPNVRRVLDAVHRQMPERKHYFIWSTALKGELAGPQGILHDVFKELFQESHQRLGLNPVWFYWRAGTDSHSDLPDILDAIREV